ncbi:PLP-dependent transferase [Phaeosphaeriaceae sp. SRC1lsM3a]|nr:PLP-dependent transferase [Stagonospora sp. SRC1lsM3a]
MDGKWVYTSDDRKILDASGGAGVSCIGSNDQRVQDAINEQNKTGVTYAAPLDFVTMPAMALEGYLVDSTHGDLLHMEGYGSGSEAVDAAVKVAHQFHTRSRKEGDPERNIFIARSQSYHGATIGALNISGHAARRAPYTSILPETSRFISSCYEYRGLNGRTQEQYIQDLAKELDDIIQDAGWNKVAAVILEPVVGAALGCVAALPGYLKAMQDVCRPYGVLLILDEIMCGMGRTGSMYAYQQHEGVRPDILLLGKGLAGGYIPLSAMLVSKEIATTLQMKSRPSGFNHGHTFQKHPVACAAALAVQDVIYKEDLVKNVDTLGPRLGKMLRARLGDHKYVGEIRGLGYMWALEFVKDKVTKEPFDPGHKVAWKIHDLAGLTKEHEIYTYLGTGSVHGTAGDFMMIMPALNTTVRELEMIVDRVAKLVTDFFEKDDCTMTLSNL